MSKGVNMRMLQNEFLFKIIVICTSFWTIWC
jgi:hypothetical protein